MLSLGASSSLRAVGALQQPHHELSSVEDADVILAAAAGIGVAVEHCTTTSVVVDKSDNKSNNSNRNRSCEISPDKSLVSNSMEGSYLQHHRQEPPTTLPKSGTGMSRSKSMFSMSSTASSTTSVETSVGESDVPMLQYDHFGQEVRMHTHGHSETPIFDGGLRKVMEPHLRRARLKRERSRSRYTQIKVDACIADSVGVPYTSLRHERPFLFDEYSYPLHQVLEQTLQVTDLSTLHKHFTDEQEILKPLLDPERRRAFHSAYDSFVTSFCVPLLHSLAIAKNVLHTSSSDQIAYRYQAFPTIRVMTPGATASGPVCDSSEGHSIGCLHFHIPLTSSFGTNALYTESHPGREDWHPLSTKSVGLGYMFDGARCLHFEMENTTDITRVSLDFRVLIYREFYGRMTHDGGLCPEHVIEDNFSRSDPNYYDEAIVDLGHTPIPGAEIVIKKYGDRLQPPSRLVGPPFG